MKIAVYNQKGKELEQVELPAEIFGLKINASLIRQALTAQLANSRKNIAHTKDRSEVRGGGKKPWKQKGTGRARHGSNRSPIWIGGGITFGPRKEKNFSLKINKAMKRKALCMVLAGKAKDAELILLDELKLNAPKTKEMAVVIKNLKTIKNDLGKGALIVLSEKNEAVLRASKNIQGVLTIGARSLNIVDLLSSRYLIMPKSAIEAIKNMYTSEIK